jgi:hypothetical protein
MKKIIVLLVISFAFLAQGHAQSCACNPNGFNPFVYSYAGETRTVRAENQFSVKCKTPVKLNGGYKCTGGCGEAKFSAVLKNSSGAIVKNYPEFVFPWEHEFKDGGNYTLEITPVCGLKKCTVAKFYFNVVCVEEAGCKCDPANRWDRFTAYIGTTSKTVICGSTLSLVKEQQFGLEGGYKCQGNCTTKFSAVLVNTTTGSIAETFESFNFTWLYKFYKAGKYKLVITPKCNGKECTPCHFNFEIN